MITVIIKIESHPIPPSLFLKCSYSWKNASPEMHLLEIHYIFCKHKLEAT